MTQHMTSQCVKTFTEPFTEMCWARLQDGEDERISTSTDPWKEEQALLCGLCHPQTQWGCISYLSAIVIEHQDQNQLMQEFVTAYGSRG